MDSTLIPHACTNTAWCRLASEFEMGSGAGGYSMVLSDLFGFASLSRCEIFIHAIPDLYQTSKTTIPTHFNLSVKRPILSNIFMLVKQADLRTFSCITKTQPNQPYYQVLPPPTPSTWPFSHASPIHHTTKYYLVIFTCTTNNTHPLPTKVRERRYQPK